MGMLPEMRRWMLATVWLLVAATAGRAADDAGTPTVDSRAAASGSVSQPPLSGKLKSGEVADILKLDIEQLGKVPVHVRPQQTNLTAPSSQLSAAGNMGEAVTTADLLRQAPSVSARRVSAITLDPRIRGYHSSQLNATANGMNQLKVRVDIDSLFSQIDPGVVQDITIIDGPYTSLYGPGFAFMVADLLPTPRFSGNPETHVSSSFVYGSNAQTLYSRDNAVSGGKDWGACVSYGLRTGNDYRTGGEDGYLTPSRYQKWDGLVAVSYDLDPIARLEFDCLRTEMNDVELPGVVYDIRNSRNDQYNLSYVIQEDRDGPKQVVFQSWYNRTAYYGNSLRPSKQETLYRAFFSEPDYDEYPVNTRGFGSLDSLGVRFLRTFGNADSAQLTLGADWRRYRQWYDERNYNADGVVVYWGDVYGIPRSQMDDCGSLMNLMMPLSDRFSVTVGGRVDQCTASMDPTDPVVVQFDDPSYYYYPPGFQQPSKTLGMAYITAKEKLTDASTLKFGAAFAMRMPDLTELYNDEPYVPLVRFGNSYVDGYSELVPEKNLQFDLGLTYTTTKAKYGARGFFSIIRDYIMPAPGWVSPTPPDFISASKVLGRNFQYFPRRDDIGTTNENADTNETGFQYLNIAEASLLGGDLFGEYQISEGFSVFGNMSYVYGVNNSPLAFYAADSGATSDGEIIYLGGSDGLPGIYPLNGAIGIRVFEPTEDRWCVEFLTRMVRTQDHVAVTLSEIPNPGFTTFALRGYYRVRKNVRISVDLENLLNRAYSEPGSLAIIGPTGLATFVQEPGFSALLGIDARF